MPGTPGVATPLPAHAKSYLGGAGGSPRYALVARSSSRRSRYSWLHRGKAWASLWWLRPSLRSALVATRGLEAGFAAATPCEANAGYAASGYAEAKPTPAPQTLTGL